MKINKLLILIFLLSFAQINGTSLVYSLRIRRLFTLGISLLNSGKSKAIGSVLPIVFQRDRHIVEDDAGVNIYEKALIGGAILNFRYVEKKWWLEAATGIEKEWLKSSGTLNFKTSRTGMDDVLISGGYNDTINDKSQFVLYGMAGFPTRTKVTALESYNTLVGTRFFGLGGGAEVSYSFINSIDESLVAIAQIRFIHFFARKWFPILPKDAKIQPGNTIDLLFTLQYRKTKNIFELGYNPTFFTNQAVVLKTQTIEANNVVRHGGYVTYARLFEKLPGFPLPGVIECGLSFSKLKRFNTRAAAVFFNFTALF
jgi:hypothetical protein